MPPALLRLLLGRESTGFRGRWPLFAATLFATTFGAYAAGVFDIAGGVVFLPGQAALVGVVAAGVVGSDRDGLAAAWVVAFAALLGYRADHAFLGLSARPFAGRLAYFLDPEGLAVFGIQGVVVGTLGFAAGWAAERGIDALRRLTAADRAD